MTGQILAVSLLVLLLVVLVLAWVAGHSRRLHRRRLHRAQVGEEEAAVLLEQAGYTVLAAQHEGALTALVDDQPCSFALRADYLVRSRRDGRLLIAEVKTGAVARSLQHGPTRRQLLEYALAYGGEVDGVLLVTPEQTEITSVSFPALRAQARAWSGLLLFVAGAALGAGGMAALSSYLLICR